MCASVVFFGGGGRPCAVTLPTSRRWCYICQGPDLLGSTDASYSSLSPSSSAASSSDVDVVYYCVQTSFGQTRTLAGSMRRNQTFKTETKSEIRFPRPRLRPREQTLEAETKTNFLASSPVETEFLVAKSTSRPKVWPRDYLETFVIETEITRTSPQDQDRD